MSLQKCREEVAIAINDYVGKFGARYKCYFGFRMTGAIIPPFLMLIVSPLSSALSYLVYEA